ncbi:VOC family protein [Pedobacter sp. UBA5917]|jgi:catechol 2,3-dioxygenase-like lactoylglutathione lyase family enzyme|uniref:VOC family protein n=1 Tax=Pedobacter sp. UBA5917 TaxID=1947061 RepID=UPI0025EF1440|nr:VOC family protein [Pedobacter sp. UBA5917]
MKRLLSVSVALLLTATTFSQNKLKPVKTRTMKFNAGIITNKIAESKAFYTGLLNFGVTFENEFYLLLHSPGEKSEISFLLPDHKSQQPLFHKAFNGQGIYLTIEVDNVDEIYKALLAKNVKIKVDLRDEPWGDRHFAIEDPNGVAIDIVTYSPR